MNHIKNWKIPLALAMAFIVFSLSVPDANGTKIFQLQTEASAVVEMNITIRNQNNELLTWESGIDFNKNYILKVAVGDEFRIIKMLVKLVRGSQQVAELNLTSGTADIKKWSGQLLPGNHVIIQILAVGKVGSSGKIDVVPVNELINIPMVTSE